MQTIKLVVVGDGDTGKQALLMTYTGHNGKQMPTVFDNYAVTVMIGGEAYTLGIFDTAVQRLIQKYTQLAFKFKFGLDKLTKWVPEISHHCPATPFLLVGTQVHLRDDSDTLKKLAQSKQQAVTFTSGEKLARELKAVKYVECSAETEEGLKNVFDEAILAALEPPDTKPKKHCILL